MKTTANIATMVGREQHLANTIQSIYSQFDKIRVVCNGMNEPPKCLQLPKIEPIIGMADMTDNGKFYALDKIKANEYYFTLDDDIIYPSDYVDKTVDYINKYKCIVTYHGRILKGEGLNYYRGHRFFHCTDKQDKALRIDVCGTGVTAFDTSYFHPKGLAQHPYQRMSDVVFSERANEMGKVIGLMPKSQHWIKPQHVVKSIYTDEVNSAQTKQIELANKIWQRLN
jgi:hypothetical protein